MSSPLTQQTCGVDAPHNNGVMSWQAGPTTMPGSTDHALTQSSLLHVQVTFSTAMVSG